MFSFFPIRVCTKFGVFFLADLQAAAAGVDDLGLESKGLARPCVNL